MFEYDIEIEERFGILEGVGQIVFIKTGRGTSIYGKDNKYLDLAKLIRNGFGCSVVVAPSIPDEDSWLREEVIEVSRFLDLSEGITFIGVSYGALIGAQQAWQVPTINQMVLINGPLMINWKRTMRGLEEFCGWIKAVYGEDDPSFAFIELLQLADKKEYHFDCSTVEGVDCIYSDTNGYFKEQIMSVLDGFYLNIGLSDGVWVCEDDTDLPCSFGIARRDYKENGHILVRVKLGRHENYIIRVCGNGNEVIPDCEDEELYYDLRIIADYVKEHYVVIRDYQCGEISEQELLDSMDSCCWYY